MSGEPLTPERLAEIHAGLPEAGARLNGWWIEAVARDLLAEVERLSARLAAVRELHHPWPRSLGWVPGPVCEYDTELWPCPTARAIGES